MKKTTILRTLTTTAFAAMCLCTSVFASGNITVVGSIDPSIYESRYLSVDFLPIHGKIVATCSNDNVTFANYEDILVNENGYMGRVIKMPKRDTYVTNKGKDSLTSVQEKSETYNNNGIIEKYIDMGNSYTDVLND